MNYISDTYTENLILNNKKFGIFFDMGTGKTSTMLSVISNLSDKLNVLIICPKAVSLFTWQNETKKFDEFEPLLKRMRLISGSEEKRTELLNDRSPHIDIISSSLLTWLAFGKRQKVGKKVKWQKDFETPEYNMIIVDECSQFKDPTTDRYSALDYLSQFASRLYLLSGTPFSNIIKEKGCYTHANELYYLLHFLGIIKYTYWEFRNKFTYKIFEDDHQIRISEQDYDTFIKLIREKSIFKKLVLPVEMKEYKIYSEIDTEKLKSLKEDYVVETDNLTNITAQNKAIMINKALQLSNGFLYDDQQTVHRFNTNKLDDLQMLLSFSDEHFIIFYNFREDLEQILKIPDTVLYEGEEQEKKWNNGEIKYLVLSPFSSKYGLNLQSGGYNIVWYGLIWSSEAFTQSNARLYRKGQQNDVKVFYLLSRNSFDDYVLSKLNKKINNIEDLKNFKKIFKK